MKQCKQYRNGGFSLLEALLAAMLLGMAVVALCGVSNHALVQVMQNSDDEIAWMVLDKELTRIGYVGIDTVIMGGVTEGVNDDFDTPYNWQIAIASVLEYDYLHKVTMSVTWQVGKRQKTISTSTYFNGRMAGL